MASLSDSTYKQYDGCIKSWIQYCTKNNVNILLTSAPTVLNFLTDIFDKGAKYGTINSYKSALSLLLGSKILNDEIVKRFMKGVFKLRPIKPRYNLTWDPSTVLNYLAQKWPNEDLNLETLTKKTVTLLALVTAHRMQTLSFIKISNISIRNSRQIIIKIPDLIKTSRPNCTQPVLVLPYFNERPEICPARSLEAYLNKTQYIRNKNDYLFISFKRPHSKVSPQTLGKWIKQVLCCSGIDTSIFTAHSTRHAATSSANKLGVSIDIIRKTAGWTNSSCVFAKYYNKEIVSDSNEFAIRVLSVNNNL